MTGLLLAAAAAAIPWGLVLVPRLHLRERAGGGVYGGILVWLAVALVVIPPTLTLLAQGRLDVRSVAGQRFLLDPVLAPSAVAVSRLIEGVIVVVSLLALDPALHRPGRAPAVVPLSLVAGWAVLAASTWLNGAGLDAGLFVVPLALVAVWRSSAGVPSVVDAVRRSMLAVCYGSLVFWLLRPDLALAGQRRELAAVFPGRLAGLTEHPNSLGGIAAAALVLAFVAGRRGRAVHVGCAGLVLVATDSTTSLAAAAAALVVVLGSAGRSATRTAAERPGSARGVLALAVVAVGMSSLGVLAVQDNSRGGLTGRVELWRYARLLWARHPILGNGSDIWVESRAISGGAPSWAGQAHNQVLDTLAVTGLVGLAVLLVFVASSGWYALAQARAGLPVASAMWVLVVVRGMAETPLALKSVASASFGAVVLLAVVAAGTAADRRPSAAREPAVAG